MMMMFLIERSECDDDDAVLIEISEYDDDDVLIERSEYDDELMLEYDDQSVMMMIF